MGGSNFSSDFHAERSTLRSSAGVSGRTTLHTQAVAEGKAKALHDKMNPYGVKVRESRDSAVHPNSTGVVIQVDVTGSMGQVPVQLQQHLTILPETLIKAGHLADAAIMMMAIGDAYTDQVPLQVGQFESGNEMDEDLDRLFIEGGGSPGATASHESYELGMYFVARHTAMDCWEKRKRKGYYFIIGDEMPYPKISREQVINRIGSGLEEDVTIEDIITELQERFHVYFLLANTPSGRQPSIRTRWAELLGENVIDLPQPEDAATIIANCINANEELLLSQDAAANDSVDKALAEDAEEDAPASGGGTAVAAKPAKPGKVKRL